LARTAHFKERGPLRGPDHVAERFLTPALRLLTRSHRMLALIRWVYGRKLPGAYAFVFARTQFFDDVFVSEVTDGARQVVILGAGFDSRAHRFESVCRERDARVFELDFPATSVEKQSTVRQVFGGLPAHVQYVPIDFNATPLETGLADAGYDPALRTAFLWEGVTFYLANAAVESVLRFVASRSGPRSAIVFDYADNRIFEPETRLLGAREVLRFTASKGEPFTFAQSPERMTALLAGCGLACERDLSPDEIEERYLRRPDGSLLGRTAGCYRLAVARGPDASAR
jgi:methyltransferase (TIGR00027 family)